MEEKMILFDLEAREKIKKGVDTLANAVKVTLGPKGRNVILEKKGGTPLITKDGVSVAKEIYLNDPIENLAAQLVKDVASKTADSAGDGTTTATVLTQAIYSAGIKNVTAGANPTELKKGIDKAVSKIVENLKNISKPIVNGDELKQVATISANNDEEIGMMIADVIEKVGKNGVVAVEEAKGTNDEVKIVEGMQFDKGYLSPYFVTDREKMEVELENPLILVYDKKISSIKESIHIYEQIAKTGKTFLIIAEDVEGDALAALVVNKIRGTLRGCAVKAPAFGDRRKAILEDIAILTGATFITEEHGYKLENVTLEHLGSAEKIIIDKDTTTIINGKGDKEKIKNRVDELKLAIEKTTSEYEKEKLRERLAKIDGGVGVIYIGAATEVEMKEKKDRVDDALHATRAAIEEGIVPGGGIALLRASEHLDTIEVENQDQKIGVNIIKKAIEAPFRTIVSNAGLEPSVILEKVKKGSFDYGYDARKDEYVSLIKKGIIDPTKVTRLALENAASVAGLLLTTECVIATKTSNKENKKPEIDGIM